MFLLRLLLTFILISFVHAQNCTGTDNGCAAFYTGKACTHLVYDLEEEYPMPDLGYMGLDYMITSVVVTKLCILELYSEPNYKGHKIELLGNRLSAQYYPVYATETVSARCSCHVDPGPEPDPSTGFPAIAIIILAIIGVAAAVALCAFFSRMPSAPLEAPPTLAGEINHTYITDGPQTRSNHENAYAGTPREQTNE